MPWGFYRETPHRGSKRVRLPGIFKKAQSCCHSEIFLKYAKRRFCGKIKEKSLLLWADFSLYPASAQIIAEAKRELLEKFDIVEAGHTETV